MTRLTKPVTRVVEIDGHKWNVTLDYAGVTFRAFRARSSSAFTQPYSQALTRAAWLNGEKPAKKRIKRGHSLKRGR